VVLLGCQDDSDELEDSDQTGAIAEETDEIVDDGEPEFSAAPTNAVFEYTDETIAVANLKQQYATALVDGKTSTFTYNREATTKIRSARSFNITDSHNPQGFVWNDTDRDNEKYYPQGIAGISPNAPGRPLVFGDKDRRLILACWYSKHSTNRGSG